MKAFFYFPLILAIYLIICRLAFGPDRSISDTYRHLKNAQKIFFSLALWFGVAVPMFILGVTMAAGTPFQFLWFLAGASILFTGAAPVFWVNGLEQKIHIITAVSGIALGIAALVITAPTALNISLVGIYLIFAFTQTAHNILKLQAKVQGFIKTILKPVFYVSRFFDTWKLKNNTYYIELAAIVIIYTGLRIYYLNNQTIF